MPVKEKLKTIRVDSEWKVYRNSDDRHPATAITIKPVAILRNDDIYKKHNNISLENSNNVQNGLPANPYHSPGYYRGILATILTAVVLAEYNTSVIYQKAAIYLPDPGTDAAKKDGVNVSALIIPALLIAVAGWLFGWSQKAKENYEAEKKSFQEIKALITLREEADKEIAIKDKAIRNLMNFIGIIDDIGSNLEGHTLEYDMIITTLDKEDDLTIYKNLQNNVDFLRDNTNAQTVRGVFHSNNRNVNAISLEDLVIKLLLGKLAIELFAENRASQALWERLKQENSLKNFVIQINNANIAPRGHESSRDLLLKDLINILKEEEQLNSLSYMAMLMKKLNVPFEMELNNATRATIIIINNALEECINHKLLQKNIRKLINNDSMLKKVTEIFGNNIVNNMPDIIKWLQTNEFAYDYSLSP